MDVLSSGLNTRLKTLDSLTKSFGTNKHVTSLGDLKLISVLTEQGAIGIKRIDSFIKLGGIGVSG